MPSRVPSGAFPNANLGRKYAPVESKNSAEVKMPSIAALPAPCTARQFRPALTLSPHGTFDTKRKINTQRMSCLDPDAPCPLIYRADHRMVNRASAYFTNAGRSWISSSNPGNCTSSSLRAGSIANSSRSSTRREHLTLCSPVVRSVLVRCWASINFGRHPCDARRQKRCYLQHLKVGGVF